MDIASLRKEYNPANLDLGRGHRSTKAEILEAFPELEADGYKPFHTPGKDLRGWPDAPWFIGGAEMLPVYSPSGAPPGTFWVGWTKQEEDGKHYCVAFEF